MMGLFFDETGCVCGLGYETKNLPASYFLKTIIRKQRLFGFSEIQKTAGLTKVLSSGQWTGAFS
jgi:hypothetical protein